jgi:hypothetical protein
MHRFAAVSLFACAAFAAQPPTFHKDVLPVLQKNCQECHRPGEAAPMAFLTFQETRPWAKAIKAAVASGKMPPWFADPHVGKFANDRSLSAVEKDVLVRWADAGAPEGKKKDAPPPREFAAGWTIGTPDVVLDMGTDFKVPAEGKVEYTYFVVPTGFTEDKWIDKVELRPGDRSVVHHVVLLSRPPKSNYLKQLKPGVPFAEIKKPRTNRPPDAGKGSLMLGGFAEVLSIYVPGGDAYATKPGQARLVEAGSDLIFQMHYTASGKETVDRSKVGIVFAKEPPKERVINGYVANMNLQIPAGAPNHQVDARFVFQDDVTLQSFFPHAHVRGKAYRYAVKYPDGRTETILNVPKYDFNWQQTYYLAEPLKLPKGTEFIGTAWYDNSPNNKFNPDPNADVYWGDQTWEEMLAAFIDFVIPVGYDPSKILRPAKAPMTE